MATKPAIPNPFDMVAGSQTPNKFQLGLITTQMDEVASYLPSELIEVDTSQYGRIDVDLEFEVSPDNKSAFASCESFIDDDGVEQYLDFFCGNPDTDVVISGVVVYAVYDDGEIPLYVYALPAPVFWHQPDDGYRVQRIDLIVDTL